MSLYGFKLQLKGKLKHITFSAKKFIIFFEERGCEEAEKGTENEPSSLNQGLWSTINIF